MNDPTDAYVEPRIAEAGEWFLTLPEAPMPPSMCAGCGAVVADQYRHKAWHDYLRRALNAPSEASDE